VRWNLEEDEIENRIVSGKRTCWWKRVGCGLSLANLVRSVAPELRDTIEADCGGLEGPLLDLPGEESGLPLQFRAVGEAVAFKKFKVDSGEGD